MFAKVHVHPFHRKTFTKLTFEKLFKSEAVHVHRFSQKFSKSRGKIGKKCVHGASFQKTFNFKNLNFQKIAKSHHRRRIVRKLQQCVHVSFVERNFQKIMENNRRWRENRKCVHFIVFIINTVYLYTG